MPALRRRDPPRLGDLHGVRVGRLGHAPVGGVARSIHARRAVRAGAGGLAVERASGPRRPGHVARMASLARANALARRT